MSVTFINTVVLIKVGYFVLLNYSYKSWSIIKTRTDLKSAGPDVFKTHVQFDQVLAEIFEVKDT